MINSQQQCSYAYVGCRTTQERNARGLGINVYRIENGFWHHVQLVKTKQENPSFLTLDHEKKYLYAVHGDFGEVSAYRIDKASGKLSFINQQSTNGKNPVHLVVSPNNNFLIIANYATGSVVSLPIYPEGAVGSVVDQVELPGKTGPHRTQQASSHPHHTVFDPHGKYIFVPDKGLDKIFAFKFNNENGRLIPAHAAETIVREGAAPRHIVFHRNRPMAYVSNELDSSITTYQYDEMSGELRALQIIPCIPEIFTGNNTAAEIMVGPSGHFVYVSNRGHDSIGIFAIDRIDGTLSPIGWENSHGKGPRFFNFDPNENFLYAANENSDTIFAFEVDKQTGRLIPTGQIVSTGSPVCIEFLSLSQ